MKGQAGRAALHHERAWEENDGDLHVWCWGSRQRGADEGDDCSGGVEVISPRITRPGRWEARCEPLDEFHIHHPEFGFEVRLLTPSPTGTLTANADGLMKREDVAGQSDL